MGIKMDIFSKTKEDEIQFNEFLDKIDAVYERLKKYERQIDISDLQTIKKSFLAKTEDFFRVDRKLNIGIIGRVKAGKSSFLNTLLFDGRNVLPNAVTPKTATLTKIEFDEENRLEINYYTEGEWNSLKKKAQVQSEVKEFVAAKEVVKMTEERKLDPTPFIKRGKEEIRYESYEELMGELNEYIGENGKYTPLVKDVTIFVNNPELEDISVVDTPGLFDPVLSRIDKTKQFMELCDVVFFLSKSTGFLDKNDIDLMAAQLPQKGVKKLILVCSRFDDGLRDTIWSNGSLEEAITNTKEKLRKYARKAFKEFSEQNYHLNGDLEERCRHPIFVSSMASNMLQKKSEDYTEQEKKVYHDLNVYSDLSEEKLKEIGNMEEVRDLFHQIIEDKEIMLEEKAASFSVIAKEELKDKLIRLRKISERRIIQLEKTDKEQILAEKKVVSQQINKVNSALEEIFGEINRKIDANKAQAIRTLRTYNRDYLNIDEKEGVEKHYEVVKVPAGKWFAPWTWGTTKREIYTYEEKYAYVDILEAVEKVRSIVDDSITCIEEAFNDSINISLLKHNLLNTIIANLDIEAENYDPDYYKCLVEQTIHKLKIPTIEIYTAPLEEKITGQFTGEVVGHANKANIKALYAKVITEVFDIAYKNCEDAVTRFRFHLDEIKVGFSKSLLEDINKELSLILKQYDNKEEEISNYKGLVEEINKIDV